MSRAGARAQTRIRRLRPSGVRSRSLRRGRGVRTIGVGWHHTCAARRDGHVECRGRNESGQLGDGSQIDSRQPTAVVGVDQVIALAAGAAHTCARTERGLAYCWGSNAGGQLGDGSTTDRLQPAAVLGLADPLVELKAGSTFTCGLTTESQVFCWGEFGFLPESGSIHPFPAPIPGLPADIAELASGDYHLWLRTSEGNVSCMGSIFTAEDPAGPPFDITGLAGKATDIIAGADFACAATSEGIAACWVTTTSVSWAIPPRPDEPPPGFLG